MKYVLGKPIHSDITGESWELSGVAGDVSHVANGELAGTSLQDLIQKYPEALLGKAVIDRFGSEFPILVKFIDAKQDLSIQLHPNDELSQKRHNSKGKTEMWYVMDAAPDAELIIGFNRQISRDEYVQSIKEDSLLSLMNYEKVKEGDTFFINTGKIHAIGAGILLAEIQQTSDITYRIFDFNRKDKDGNFRELHTELALDAIDYEKKDDFKVAYSRNRDSINPMVYCPYFKTDYLNLTRSMEVDITDRNTFSIYICVDGSALINNGFGEAALQKGETILVPAHSQELHIITTNAKLLEVTI